MVSQSLNQEKASKPAVNSGELYVRGKWIRVPALQFEDKTIVVRGKWLKIAVIRSEEWLETELRDPELCLRTLKQNSGRGFRADIFTFTQKLPASTPQYGFPFEWESVAAVHLTNFKEWWEGLPQESRKNVRRSQKRGVVVGVRPFDDELINGIVELNNESAVRQGHVNTQYGKSFDQIKKDYSSFLDRSEFICAYSGDELIGLLKIVYRGDVASILNFLPKASHSDKRPANALIAKAMELCDARGIAYVTYGLFNYGNKGDNPLREFKVRNGFSEILMPRYYVPLNWWGRLCMACKLHLGLLGILPHRVIMAGLNLRSKWYNFKQLRST